jgi:hypothetical protein
VLTVPFRYVSNCGARTARGHSWQIAQSFPQTSSRRSLDDGEMSGAFLVNQKQMRARTRATRHSQTELPAILGGRHYLSGGQRSPHQSLPALTAVAVD